MVVEPDDDAWHASCPALEAYGAATWGETREEALRHIRKVVEMVVAELVEDGEAIPADIASQTSTRACSPRCAKASRWKRSRPA